MFKRTRDDAAGSQPARTIDTLIGRTVRINGDLEFSGGLHLDGHVTGNVRADPGSASTIAVSADAVIEGSVEVARVVVNGTVRGDIVARERVTLGAQARVAGNVHYGIIEMEPGARINGKLISVSSAAAPA
jgi:cytoskeletal protein CcmA (bactofilin family)